MGVTCLTCVVFDCVVCCYWERYHYYWHHCLDGHCQTEGLRYRIIVACRYIAFVS